MQITIRKGWATFIATVLAIMLILVTAACTNSKPQQTENSGAQTGEQLLLNNQPVPIFPISAYRANGIVIEAIQALGSPTTTFEFPPGSNGSSGVKPIKVCASQGLPIAVNAEVTNPVQTAGGSQHWNGAVIGQMDPNGMYSSPSSTGTDVLCLDAQGNSHLSYWEGDVEAESGVAVWSPTAGIVDQGPSQLPICSVVTSQGENGIAKGTLYTKCVKAPQTAAWTKRWLQTDLALSA